jgi:hypothetical protein
MIEELSAQIDAKPDMSYVNDAVQGVADDVKNQKEKIAELSAKNDSTLNNLQDIINQAQKPKTDREEFCGF